ncbi:MAG: hypothetical protein C4520_03500 [Candidatus Abyssobacteria bacterium SURF_5]|uniref:Uncharacterized protein n=1 Tax=Abyssobacteria bacterium (strain SURF_5) TaxID=2093360 RepID=A0A3A4NW66_ABYX5|nr:MAG: hypothetical protein C4520_03500 [Candidatus Abyssubacteria bacterium SURF_5]
MWQAQKKEIQIIIKFISVLERVQLVCASVLFLVIVVEAAGLFGGTRVFLERRCCSPARSPCFRQAFFISCSTIATGTADTAIK